MWNKVTRFTLLTLRRTSEGFDLIILSYLLYVFGKTGLAKQCRSRSDATERGVWSGSTLFCTHQTILHTFTGSKVDLLKRSLRKNVLSLSNSSKISHEKEILSQWGFERIPLTPSEFAPAGSKIWIIPFYHLLSKMCCISGKQCRPWLAACLLRSIESEATYCFVWFRTTLFVQTL